MVQLADETLISVPNSLLESSEVRSFIRFLEAKSNRKVLLGNTKTQVHFEALFQTWKKEVGLLSSATAITQHAAYQQIITMGATVVPFILIKLQQEPQHLFFALFQITGENPVPIEHAGHLEKMTNDWLNWGIEKGYIVYG